MTDLTGGVMLSGHNRVSAAQTGPRTMPTSGQAWNPRMDEAGGQEWLQLNGWQAAAATPIAQDTATNPGVFRHIQQGLRSGLLLSASIKHDEMERELPSGLRSRHVYSVHRAVETLRGEQLIALRNPWGSNGWRGYGGVERPVDWERLAVEEPGLVDELGGDFGRTSHGLFSH